MIKCKFVSKEIKTYGRCTVCNLAESRAKKKAYRFCYTLSRLIAEELGEYAEAMSRFHMYRDKEIVHQAEILES